MNSNDDRMSKIEELALFEDREEQSSEKIEELRSMLRRDKFHIIWACMKCLENEVEPTVERVALYSYNTVEFVRNCEAWWRELLV